MIEFILIIIMGNGPAYNGITILDGFTSITQCETAADKLKFYIDYEVETLCLKIDK